MRIVMVVGKSTGGLGSHVEVLAKQLRARGHQVRILTDALTAKHFAYEHADLLWPVRPRSLHAFTEVRSRLRQARKLLASADVVHAHGYQAALLSAHLLRRRYRVPLVASLHDSINRTLPAILRWVITRLIVQSAALVTGASSDLVERMTQLGARRSELAPIPSPKIKRYLEQQPLDRRARAENWRILAAEEHLDNRGQLILSVGRIEASKRYDQLIKAMHSVTCPATAVVIGAGNLNLMTALRSQGPELKVHFLGGRENLDAWYLAATALVVTSAWEARSLVVQEALAIGLPVIAPRVGGLVDLLADPTEQGEDAGILVNPDRPEETGAALGRLLTDPSLWYECQRRGRAHATSWQTLAQVVSRWEEHYLELCPQVDELPQTNANASEFAKFDETIPHD